MNLSDSQQRLYEKLQSGDDVPIRILFRSILRRWPEAYLTTSQQQMRISPYLMRLRRKLAPHYTVVPGVRRGTYRLKKIDD